MTTKTVQKHLLLHGFLYYDNELCKQKLQKQSYDNYFMVTVSAWKYLKYNRNLLRTEFLCKPNYVNYCGVHAFICENVMQTIL